MKKVSFLLILLCMGLLAFGGSASAWDFPKLNFGSSYSSSTAYTPTAYASSTAAAFGCGDCVETYTNTTSFARCKSL